MSDHNSSAFFEQGHGEIYESEDVYNACMKYFQDDSLAVEVFMNKYALKDKDGKFLEKTPAMMHRRLAREFARIEQKYENPLPEEEIFYLFDKFRYVSAQGSPMSALGDHERYQSLSNCFVINGPGDSYGGILRADQEQAQIMKRRGGVGFDITRIRPRGMRTRNAAITTDGIEVFMKRFSNTCEEVAQGGRRGALMLTLNSYHPQVEDFIKVKRDNTSISGANISVRFDDKFMNAIVNDETVTLKWPVDDEDPKISFEVKALDVWKEFVKSNWISSDPGAQFIDNLKRSTPSEEFAFKGHGSCSSNPCAEQHLPAYDSCRLLLLNLKSYVKNAFTKDVEFDIDLFVDHVMKAQRLMDDLVDLEIEAVDRILQKIEDDPEDEEEKSVEKNLWTKIKRMALSSRRTGLGVTGVADVIASSMMKYGSKESLELMNVVMQKFALAAHKSSVILAKERGAFDDFEPGIFERNEFFERLLDLSDEETNEMYYKYGRRNICATTMAPAGSTSMMMRVSSGSEPVIVIEGKRRRRVNLNDTSSRVDEIDDKGEKWQYYTVRHLGHSEWMLMNEGADESESPYAGSTISEVDPLEQVKVLAVLQKWVENSISKTVNLPESATEDQISDIYISAWKLGCKGITVYRYGSKKGIIFDKDESQDPKQIKFMTNVAPKRPKSLPCEIHNTSVKGEKWTLLVGMLDGNPYEVFGGLSKYIEIPRKYTEGVLTKNGKKNNITTYNLTYGEGDDQTIIKDVVSVFDNPTQGALTRIISLSLRHGAAMQHVVEQLQKDKYSDIMSFSRVIARILKKYIPDGTVVGPKCEKCGGLLVYTNTCKQCQICGFSECL